jgi:tRNA-dihydrouridine synthase B
MARAADSLNDRENVFLDVNMGCPVTKVVKNGEGSALLKDPALAGQIIRAMTGATVKPITVKIRIGWDKDDINAVEMAKVLEDAGAAAVAVHGRTREQFYSGRADWDIIRRVKEAVTIPVIGNGDVFSGADALRMLEETGCDYVMIGRGALGNPWIFRDALEALRCHSRLLRGDPDNIYAKTAISGTGNTVGVTELDTDRTGCAGTVTAVSLDEKLNILRRHFNMLIAEIGEYRAIREMRKHTAWYLKGVRGSSEMKRRVNSLTDSRDFFRAIDDFSGIHKY